MTKCKAEAKDAKTPKLVVVPEQGLLDVAQLATFLGMSKAFVWKQVRENLGLPHLRLGKAIRFDREAVRTWLAAQAKSGQRE